ncbi:MAG: CopG family antitoxin [Nocardioidaceae bacterium]
MEHGHWVEHQPMATTSLRLPVDVIAELKQEAQNRGVRYTSYVRSILEHATHPQEPSGLAEINQRLAHIEHTLAQQHDNHPRKSA